MVSPTTIRTAAAHAATPAASSEARAHGAGADGFLALLAAAGSAEGIANLEPAEERAAPEAAAEEAASDALTLLFAGMLPVSHATPLPLQGNGQPISGEEGDALLDTGPRVAPDADLQALDGATSIDATMFAAMEAVDPSAQADALLPDALQKLLHSTATGARDTAADPRPTVNLDLSTLAATATSATQGPQSTGSALVAATPEQALRSAVGTPRWADELGTRLVMMSTRGQQEGSLSLTPEHLGPLEVRITVNQNVASVWFGAQQADTRAALAEAMPRLRELFAESGLALGHAGVSQDAPRQGTANTTRDAYGSATADQPSVPEVRQAVRQITRGLVDLYA